MTGAIICGGKSTRMGRPKAGMRLSSGITMIEHVHAVLSEICPRVVLAGAPPDLPSSLNTLERITDRIKDAGPIGGLEALLASDLDSEYLVLPCDLPRIDAATLHLLCNATGSLPIVLRTHKCLQPLVARYDAAILPEIRERMERGLYSLKAMLHDIDHTEIPVPAHLAAALQNVNTVRDFGRIEL